MVVSYYLQQQQEDIEEEERNETLHQTKLSSISISLIRLHEYAYLSCSQVEFQRTIDQIYAYPTVSYSMSLHGNTLIALLLHRILQIATNKSI